MKRFIIFGFDQYYPQGGFQDFLTSFDTKEEVKAYLENSAGREYYQVFDLDKRKVVNIKFKEETYFELITPIEGY